MKYINTFFLFIILTILTIAHAQATDTPVIAFNWLDFRADSTQCLTQAEAAMAATDFSTKTTKTFVVGAYDNKYKGMIRCLPSKNMVVFTVTGQDFLQANQLTQQLRNHFKADPEPTTPTTYQIGKAPQAPYMAYNWQNILPNCTTRATDAMENLGFSVSQKKSFVIGSHDDGYKAIVVCLPKKKLTYFTVSGDNFDDAQQLTASIKVRFNGQKSDDQPSENALTITSLEEDEIEEEEEENIEEAIAAPSISYQWQETGANTKQCLKEAKNTMIENGFTADMKRTLVVGANEQGYKGVVICIPAKKMTLFIVGGEEFNTAAKLSSQLKTDF